MSKIAHVKTVHEVARNYRRYHAGFEALSYRSIKPVSADAFGVRIEFASNLTGFSHVECSADGEPFVALDDNTLFAAFDPNRSEEQHRDYLVRPVGENWSGSSDYRMHFRCQTIRMFEAQGGSHVRNLCKITCDPEIHQYTGAPDNWSVHTADDSEKQFARTQWGDLIQETMSDYEKAKSLNKALIRELMPHSGMPLAFMKAQPTFEKYLTITSGKSGHACGQYAEIFAKALDSFGVISRFGFLEDGISSDNDEIFIEMNTSHLVTEIFDRGTNQWVFMDGRYYALGAFLGDIGPLTLHEFILFVNQPARRRHLKILHYDHENDREVLIPFDECPKAMTAYQGWTKEFKGNYLEF